MKSIIARIRKAKDWRERMMIAEDKEPGTKYDFVFREARIAEEFKGYQGIAHDSFQRLGAWLAETINKGYSPTLNEMAKALNTWKQHKPEPDVVLVTLFGLTGMFPPGWGKRQARIDPKTGHFLRDPKTGRPVLGVPKGTRVSIAIRDVERNVRQNYFSQLSDRAWKDEWPRHHRRAQKYAKQFKLNLDETPGRPPKKS